MKTRFLLTLLGLTCCLSLSAADCDLSKRKAAEAEFPDIEKYAVDSYIMGVEYSTPKADETSYFTEYYDILFTKGRIESHVSNTNTIYLYYAESEESWTMENGKCKYANLSSTPEFFKSDQTEWNHFNEGNLTTVGPSAMFKRAYDVWKKPDRKDIMAYMGISNDLIRGEKAVYWRRCTEDKKFYIDYYFADQRDENPFDTGFFKKTITPLRVSFYGVSSSEMTEFSEQHYDIISFQHFIPPGLTPFQLPVGKNCSRSFTFDGPKMPNFSGQDLYVSAEVVYQKFKSGSTDPMGTYYSTLTFALDRRTNHISYYYSTWDTNSKHMEDNEPFINPPQSVIFDLHHAYVYNISVENGNCTVSRPQKFLPLYTFPKNTGALDLTSQYVLLPNNELWYLTSSTTRGLAVNVYEASVEMFIIGADGKPEIVKALITHSYLKTNEKLEGKAEVSGAPVQLDIRLFRNEYEELITFNLFGYSTQIPMEQRLFDVTRCHKDDDDYSIFTIGYEVEPKYLVGVPDSLPQIEESTLGAVIGRSELNNLRIPFSMASIRGGYVFVTLIVLGKPTMLLDFPHIKPSSTIQVANIDQDSDGVSDFNTCATKCLEERLDCWGFSMCGATCFYGSDTNKNVESKKDCMLYEKFHFKNTTTYMQSRERQIEDIRRLIDVGEFMIMPSLNGERVELVARYSKVEDLSMNDPLFRNLGNRLNPRMRIQKTATKLKKETEVKNMGKLAYDECQTLCLDFKDCETMSYCLKDSSCIISTKSGSELKADDTQDDNFCILLARKYTDHFENTPGLTVKGTGGTTKDAKTVEECAKACIKDSDSCLSFDHCVGGEKESCTVYKTHYITRRDKEEGTDKNTRCGHYSKKLSYDFKKTDQIRLLGSKVPPVYNLTLEECAKTCIEYGEGSCYGYDFCQAGGLYETSCTLFDSDPSRLKSQPIKMCSNYVRTEGAYAPRPFTDSYAGGIGFLCFLVGGILGAVAIFVIAYIRVNRRG